jgi:hypothetical protein
MDFGRMEVRSFRTSWPSKKTLLAPLKTELKETSDAERNGTYLRPLLDAFRFRVLWHIQAPLCHMRIPVKSATDSDDIGHPRSVATLAV